MDISSFFRADLKSLEYKGVKPLDVVAAEIGIAEEELVKLDANENLWELPKQVREAMAHSCMHIYPDPTQILLRQALSKYHGINENQICAGSGSDDILDIVTRLIDSESVIISPPTFGMYSFLAKLAGKKTIEVARKPNFILDTERVIAAIRENNCKLVFFPSPNNPTGNVVSNDDVEKLCQESCIVVMDEAYADFSGVTAMTLIDKYPNLLVIRTFSKWAGLAGLRIGYAVGHPVLIERMMAIKQPYNVNAAADVSARAALEYRKEISVTIDAMIAERIRLSRALEDFSNITPMPSDANFVLAKVENVSAEALALSLRSQGILIRYFGQQGGDLKDYMRISAGKPQDTDKFLSSLKFSFNALNNGAALRNHMDSNQIDCILFDMDGVLANVSSSYRQCILQTAQKYQITVTSEDVNVEKAKGNANDDWILTHRMISDRWVGDKSSIPTLQQVTAAFEELYQGTDSTQGLHLTESLLPSRVILAPLGKKYKMGVVTGRPRSDAERFLKLHGIEQYFTHLVCMHEAPSKPDPAPVKLALTKLGCTKAIMIGDTVDDIRAATAAGIVAVGVPAPGHENDKTKDNFVAAGASFVLSPKLPELVALL